MRYLTLNEALELHRRIIEQSGGPTGIRDGGLLKSILDEDYCYRKDNLMGFEKINLLIDVEQRRSHPGQYWVTEGARSKDPCSAIRIERFSESHRVLHSP
jgi:hypothetical protein